VLGLDAPNLDPCVTAPCTDASVLVDATPPTEAAAADVIAEAASDTHDAADGGLKGVRCGGGGYPVSGCTGSTPMCCQTTDDAGGPVYACTDTATSCDGYPIACASNADCGGNDVCCHFTSGTKCETSCSNTSLVCEPTGPADQCPNGWKCDGAVTDDGQPAPYFLCTGP
jgi:hypothetical protein